MYDSYNKENVETARANSDYIETKPRNQQQESEAARSENNTMLKSMKTASVVTGTGKLTFLYFNFEMDV